jgi:hypothetical protein
VCLGRGEVQRDTIGVHEASLCHARTLEPRRTPTQRTCAGKYHEVL